MTFVREMDARVKPAHDEPGASRESQTRSDARAAQEIAGLHRRLAGALQLGDADGAIAAGDAELLVQHGPGLASARRQLATQDLQAHRLAIDDDLAPGA